MTYASNKSSLGHLHELLRAERLWIKSFLNGLPDGQTLVLAPSSFCQGETETSRLNDRHCDLQLAINRGQVLSPWRARVEALGLSDDSLESMILHHVMDTQPDADRWLAQAMRVVKPGGKLVLIDFNRYGPWHVLRHCQFESNPNAFDTQPRLASRDRALLQRHQFQCESIQHLGSVMPRTTQTSQTHVGWWSRWRAVHILIGIKRSGGQVIAMRDMIKRRNTASGNFQLNPSTRGLQLQVVSSGSSADGEAA